MKMNEKSMKPNNEGIHGYEEGYFGQKQSVGGGSSDSPIRVGGIAPDWGI